MPYTFSENKLLIKHLKTGKEAAFQFVFNALFDKLTTFIMSYTNDKALAKDIVQTCFMKMWEKRFELNEDITLIPYMFTMCRNQFIDTYRQNKKILRSDEAYFEAILEIENESEKINIQQKRKLDKAIEKLPKKCKEVFLLRQKDNLKIEEIANYLGISKKTVEDHISRAFRLLRQYLALLILLLLK